MAKKENHMVDRCVRTDYSCCDPSCITLDGWVTTREVLPHTHINHRVFS